MCHRDSNCGAQTCRRCESIVEELSWETPRNAAEICKLLQQAILHQWMVPSISFEENTNVYNHDEKNSSFIVSGIRTRYQVTIEEIGA